MDRENIYDDLGDGDTTQTTERPSWQQGIVPQDVEPDTDEAGEVEAEGEQRPSWQQQLTTTEAEETAEDDAGERGRELVEAEDGDFSVEKALEFARSPQMAKILEGHGIYADPSRYALPADFDPTLVGGEATLAKFFDIAARDLVPQTATDEFLGLVAEVDAQQRQAQFDADVEHMGQMQTIMRSEWGTEAQERLDELRDFVKGLPGQLGEALSDARTPDGRRLINHPDWPLVMSDLIRGNGSPRSNASERLEKINNVLKRDPARYWREKMDEEALELRRQTLLDRSAEEIAGNRPVSRREGEILAVMKRDMSEYFRRGLDKELAKIRASRASRGA